MPRSFNDESMDRLNLSFGMINKNNSHQDNISLDVSQDLPFIFQSEEDEKQTKENSQDTQQSSKMKGFLSKVFNCLSMKPKKRNKNKEKFRRK